MIFYKYSGNGIKFMCCLSFEPHPGETQKSEFRIPSPFKGEGVCPISARLLSLEGEEGGRNVRRWGSKKTKLLSIIDVLLALYEEAIFVPKKNCPNLGGSLRSICKLGLRHLPVVAQHNCDINCTVWVVYAEDASLLDVHHRYQVFHRIRITGVIVDGG